MYDLKQQQKGATAVVTLDKQANVRLMTMSQYRTFKSGRSVRAMGGLAKKSPARLGIPNSGHWVVVVDLGGLPGKVRAGVQVESPPPGLLRPLRQQDSPARDVQVRKPITPASGVLGGRTWDVFLSHASEDKESVAVPLHDALVKRGVTVWLDKAVIKIGDSLRRKIDEGIRSSRFGIVVLSPSFFAKGWTNHELDGLVTKTVAGEQTMLPIWHEVNAEEVRGVQPVARGRARAEHRRVRHRRDGRPDRRGGIESVRRRLTECRLHASLKSDSSSCSRTRCRTS